MRCCWEPWSVRLVVGLAVTASALLGAGCDEGDGSTSGTRTRVASAARAGEYVAGDPSGEGPDVAQAGKDPEYGQALYAQSCITCHGTRGQGVPRQGVNLRTSEFLAAHSDEQVVSFLKQGRPATDTASLTGLLMPPRGGNQTLDDTGLKNIVAFLRQVQDEAKEEGESATESDSAAQSNAPDAAADAGPQARTDRHDGVASDVAAAH